jgi:hypothetical protein
MALDNSNKRVPRIYTNGECVKFVQNMREAGLNLFHYNGRFYWRGPAVVVDNLQEALSETRVPCQWDNMGRGFVVYPEESDEGVEATALKCPECSHEHWFGKQAGFGLCPEEESGCECPGNSIEKLSQKSDYYKQLKQKLEEGKGLN